LVPTGGEGKGSEKPAEASATTQKQRVKGVKDSGTQPEDHYEVEKVVGHEWNPELKMQRFYVKWKGYPDSANSWVKQVDFDDVSILKKYWKDTNARITADNSKPLTKLTTGKKMTSRKRLIKKKL
jgi:hypothetical protein